MQEVFAISLVEELNCSTCLGYMDK